MKFSVSWADVKIQIIMREINLIPRNFSNFELDVHYCLLCAYTGQWNSYEYMLIVGLSNTKPSETVTLPLLLEVI